MARNTTRFSGTALYLVLTLQTFFINLVPAAFAYYITLLAHINIRGSRVYRVIFLGTFALDVLLTALNPFMRWAFVFEQEHFQTGYAGYVMYAIDLFMILLAAGTIIRYRQSFQFLHIVPILFFLLCCVSAAVIQVIQYVPMIDFMVTSLCLFLYHYQQNPEAVTDTTTNLLNRNFMGEYIQSKYAENCRFGVLVVAMDDFKFINKTYGVDNGDNLLRQVGNFLEELSRSNVVFRLGSDQFCIVVNKNIDKLSEIGNQIQERFLHPWYNESQTAIMMSSSICCIRCPEDAATYGDLIEIIDYTLSVAKKSNRGRVTQTSQIDLEHIRNDKAIERAIKLAVDRDELMVYYQPIFSVSEGKYNSAEALVRINDKELGWISPEIFIPIAEKSGLIVEMGEIILEQVCKFIHDNKLSETSVRYIEVNISPVQLLQPDFSNRVREILEKYQVKPEQINIEITETATMSSVNTITSNIDSLIDYGIKFSLDDYGSGNANISYINRMPFTIIKLDKFIVWDSFKTNKASITLEHTIGMLNALQLSIVAEGVETAEMRDRLSDFGCEYMQGWYYSKAVSDQDFMKLISA
jgi:diguanylate cyclase (GGDEF)-like protein